MDTREEFYGRWEMDSKRWREDNPTYFYYTNPECREGTMPLP